MAEEKNPPYGTRIAHPDEKAGVEVGGGDKAAASQSERAREEGHPQRKSDDRAANPDDPEEAQSPT